MPNQDISPLTTQRAYTLRLRGVDPEDQSWRDALWQTHEAVNKGAKVFGDWLLTLRGGLDHTLADKSGGGTPDEEERKARRILLALSWLSVESKHGAPEKFQITDDKVVETLEKILEKREVPENEIKQWKNDCSASLSAAIRDDAVWVNRSEAFDEAGQSICPLTSKEVWDMLEYFFKDSDAYLTSAKSSENEPSIKKQEEKPKDLVQKAGNWLSKRFGTGQGADFPRMAKVYQAIENWDATHSLNKSGTNAIASLAATALSKFAPESNDLDGVLALISCSGRESGTRKFLKEINNNPHFTQDDWDKLKKKADTNKKKCEAKPEKGLRPYSDAILKEVESVCGLTYQQVDGRRAKHPQFVVMLDHAARRVSLAHTWIKRAEAERRKFEEDAKRVDQVPMKVKDWLEKFCQERSKISGTLLEPYRIRQRAVGGWKEIVAAWKKCSCQTSADRIAAARALQDNPEIDKFGDIQLFEALAKDEAVCVWHKNGDSTKAADSQPLLDYVRATEAEFNKRRFKVPAYRHPDALLHPIFCDFGESRWDIRFDAHKEEQKPFSRKLHLTLWTGREMNKVSLRWQSKRLTRDLAFGENQQDSEISKVSRADRLGRAAANVTRINTVQISGLFEQTNWNGRLQAPRQQFEAIAAVRDNPSLPAQEREQRMSDMKNRIRWLVTFSAQLQPKGPWYEFAKENQLNVDKPHADANRNRKEQARLILSRLPGLRVLSVDLGHRHAAACAVWEAVNTEHVKEACRAAGHEAPKESDLFLHLRKEVMKQKKNTQVVVEETTIYRRIGSDLLQDGKFHPAPWARLDRQFLIKLQGEKEGARAASNEEIWAVHRLEAELGKTTPIIDRLLKTAWGESDKQKKRLDELRRLGWTPANESGTSNGTNADEPEVHKPSLSVDELFSSAIQTMRHALKRHGERARIAFAMTAEYKLMPGNRKYYFARAEELSQNENEDKPCKPHIEFIQDTLLRWHEELTRHRGWRDDTAKQLWDQHVAKLLQYGVPEEISNESSGSERKDKRNRNRKILQMPAEALVEDVELRKIIHDAWKKRWEEDDECWKKRLRWFKDWILPHGKTSDDSAIRKVGGLSLTRIANLTEFRRKIQIGFFTRLHPDGTKEETPEKFGQSTLDALEHLREQRVKQLASRIVEAALGVGRIKIPKKGKIPKRPRERVDTTCHAVVIENLRNYRFADTQPRRENRALMAWSAGKVRKYLEEACELHGLHLREVSASYTSRQDSRTGAPGIRCQDVPLKEFMRLPYWKKQVAQAEKKQAGNKADCREQFLYDLNAMWKDKVTVDWEKAGAIRIPVKGGEIFVSANPASSAVKGLQADLNAAANIGLRALMDPDWPGKWWYVPCEAGSFQPVKTKVKGSTAVDPQNKLRDPIETQSATVTTNKKVINLWRDPSSSPLHDTPGEWKEYAAYQNDVQRRVIQILREMIFCSKKDATNG